MWRCNRYWHLKLIQGTAAQDVGIKDPVGRGQVIISLHGVALAAGGWKLEGETAASQLWGENLHWHSAGYQQERAIVTIIDGDARRQSHAAENTAPAKRRYDLELTANCWRERAAHIHLQRAT